MLPRKVFFPLSDHQRGGRDSTRCSNLVTIEEYFRGSDFCRPGLFSQIRKKNTCSKSINKTYAPEAARGWIPPQRALHSPGGRAGAPGLRFMLCWKWLNHPKAAAGACPIKAQTLGKTWAQNHTQAWVDRSEDYTHPCFHPSFFSLSFIYHTNTHVLSPARSAVSILSHWAQSRASLRLIQLGRTAANETVSLSLSLSLSLIHSSSFCHWFCCISHIDGLFLRGIGCYCFY